MDILLIILISIIVLVIIDIGMAFHLHRLMNKILKLPITPQPTQKARSVSFFNRNNVEKKKPVVNDDEKLWRDEQG